MFFGNKNTIANKTNCLFEMEMPNSRVYSNHSDSNSLVYPLCQFLIFIMVLRMAFFIRQRSNTEYNNVDAYNFVNIVVTFIIAAILLLKIYDVQLIFKQSNIVIKCITFYYTFCMIIGLLSPSPEYAIFRCLEFLMCFLAIMIIMSKYSDYFKAENIVLIWITIILLIELSGHIRLSGWNAFHSTRYGVTAGILFMYSYGELIIAKDRRKHILLIFSIISGIAVFLSTSTGSILALLGGVIFLFLHNNSHRRYILVLLPFLVFLVGWNSFVGVILGGKTTEEVVSLGHRIGVWQSSWDLFVKNPFLGYGLNVATRRYGTLINSHNAYIEALLAGGMLGASILFLGILMLLKDHLVSVKNKNIGSLGCCAATIVYLINGISAPTIGYILTPHGIAYSFILFLFINNTRCFCKKPNVIHQDIAFPFEVYNCPSNE